MKTISKRTWNIGIVAVIALLLIFAMISRSKSDNASAAETTKLESITVGPENIAIATSGSIMAGPTISGTLEPEREAVLRAQVQGSVLQTYADQGQAVSAGTVLARIDATGIQDAYNSARAGVVAARNSADIASKDLARNEKLLARVQSRNEISSSPGGRRSPRKRRWRMRIHGWRPRRNSTAARPSRRHSLASSVSGRFRPVTSSSQERRSSQSSIHRA